MILHPIDQKKPNWSDEDLERMMIFCMLDRAQSYENVCKVFDHLNRNLLTSRKGLKLLSVDDLERELRKAGHRFPKQTAQFLKGFSDSTINLRTATRDDLVENLPGIGYKLASMFLRNTRGEEYAVLDVHVKRWLEERGFNPNGRYQDLERIFLTLARGMNKTPYELNMEIWQAKRIGNKRKIKV